jgi:HSP20 family protein
MSLVPRRSFFDFDDLFDLWAPRRGVEAAGGTLAPRVDVKDMKDHYEITAEMPGVKKEDLDVSLHNGVLSITAETKQENVEEKDGKVIRQERRYGRYMRSFDLGPEVSEGDIEASFTDGILKVKAPKSTPKPPAAKRIKVG